MTLDFNRLAADLLARAEHLLHQWLPGGKLVGREYTCANLTGGHGNSLKVNTTTGKWADFSVGHKGGDLISLFAAIRDIKQGDAFKQLAGDVQYNAPPPRVTKKPEKAIKVYRAPHDDPGIVEDHPKHGRAHSAWLYTNDNGEPIFWVARFAAQKGKIVLPYVWDGKRWVQRGFPSPRPLYNLHKLATQPDRKVLIVEGEKAAEAAERIVGDKYVVTTWSHGTQSWEKTDWSPLANRDCLLWADADDSGIEAMRVIGQMLVARKCGVKVIDVASLPKKWDAADSLAAGWDWKETYDRFKGGLRTIATVVVAVAKAEATVEVKVTHEPEQAPPTESNIVLWEKMGLALGNSGCPIPNIDNAVRVLENHHPLQDVIWFDEFHRRYFTSRGTTGNHREWNDVDDLDLTVYVQRALGVRSMKKETVGQAVIVYANKNIKNEPVNWLDALKWDGQSRIDDFFSTHIGSPSNIYTRSVGRNFWLSIVARVFKPGCQVDNMVVLEGRQGKRKSSALRAIGHQFFSEMTESVSSKDFFMALRGNMLVEVAELDSFSKAETSRIKQVISCRVDRYREPYGRWPSNYPRRCVFVGSTNESSYLKDSTGGRRFWPIRCGDIDVEAIERDREQLFAEAVDRMKAGEPWYIMPDEDTEQEQEIRRQADVWEDILEDYLDNRIHKSHPTSVHELAMEALKIEVPKIGMVEQRRIGTILRRLGWEKQVDWVNGKPQRRWHRNGMTTPRETD